jgi:hypothetical protein
MDVMDRVLPREWEVDQCVRSGWAEKEEWEDARKGVVSAGDVVAIPHVLLGGRCWK